MRFASLGSGSKGNCSIIEFQGTTILVDCGFGARAACSRLELLGKSPREISAIIVTHEHSDHWRGVEALSRKYDIPVYLSAGTFRVRNMSAASGSYIIIDSHKDFTVGDLSITPVPVPHDACEPLQFIICSGHHRIGFLTDLGHYTSHVVSLYNGCDALLLETNYDDDMLACGPYPQFLKERVSGAFGHLSNHQASDLLRKLDLSRMQFLLAGHVSGKNNHTERILEALSADVIGEIPLFIVDQVDVTPWFELA
ncbi:MAG: MBL fold metallo-hydrolase [Porticoccaceae bacterium]|nr:MBL fold metallo-hydrolase [Porticoccaceae bacterium]MDG1474216.1 MBL fold metallo-hydrolase [Porticoccaceae bacterium]